MISFHKIFDSVQAFIGFLAFVLAIFVVKAIDGIYWLLDWEEESWED